VQAKLIIKKRLIQANAHQIKPSVNAIARLPLNMRGLMLDSFGHESLFKKAIMIGTRPGRAGDDLNNAFEVRVLDAFFKREESLEITVSSIMIGQTYVGDSIWDALGFELVAKRAFNTMLTLLETLQQFDEEVVYLGQSENPAAQPKQRDATMLPAPAVGQKKPPISAPDQPLSDGAATARIARVLVDEIAT